MSIKVGRGVKRAKTEEVTPADSNPFPEPKEVLDEQGQPIWDDKASIEDQLINYRGTTRIGPQKFAMFNLTKEGQLAQLNTLMEKTMPENSPSIAILSQKDQPIEGGFVVLVQYREIKYKRLIPNL